MSSPSNTTLDVDFVRSHFPALDSDWALFDNAGGSVALRSVIDRVCHYMERYQVQLGASYPLSVEAGELVREGHRAMAELIGAEDGEVVIGSSVTVLVMLLAQALRPQFRDGDEIIVTNLDHETNIGAWERLGETGLVIKEWRLNPDTANLDLEDLESLLNERTRLVCFTHCANVVGRIHDVAAITRRVHEAGAMVCVDGVAFAPHRRVDVKALDVDFYLLSIYKTYGPHLGLLYGKREHLLAAKGQYHSFIAEDDVPYKLQPGNANYELTASLPALLEYFEKLDEYHFPGAGGDLGTRLDRTFDLIAEHEERLASMLLEFLASKPAVQILGPATGDRAQRVPLIGFTVDGRNSNEIPEYLDGHRLAVRYGHFYAYRPIRDLGLLDRNGIVRVSMVHYNSEVEVRRLVEALDRIL